MTEDRTALLERTTRQRTPITTEVPPADAGQPTYERVEEPGRADQRSSARGPARGRDPDETLMLWGLLFFVGLGLYATAFVAWGVWLTP